jgi:hypothetical protein
VTELVSEKKGMSANIEGAVFVTVRFPETVDDLDSGKN